MNTILNYIPQRPPFVMIDALVAADKQHAITGFKIKADNVLVDEKYFTEPGLIENMAQTAAAGSGYLAAQELQNPKVGFIGAVSKLKIIRLPEVDSNIKTEVLYQSQFMNAQIVTAKIFQNEEEIASCELKIFIQN